MKVGVEKEKFRGESCVIDGGGNILINAGKKECIMTFDIDPDESVRKNNIACNDIRYEMSLYDKYVSYNI